MADYPTVSLQPGMTGPEVKKLQDYLVSLGYMTPEEVATGPGIYGPKTTAAVAKLQAALGVDTGGYAGYWGPKTLAKLQSSTVAPATTTQTTTTSGMSALQQQLGMLGDVYKQSLTPTTSTSSTAPFSLSDYNLMTLQQQLGALAVAYRQSLYDEKLSALKQEQEKVSQAVEKGGTTTTAGTSTIIPANVSEKYQIEMPTKPPSVSELGEIKSKTDALLKWWEQEQARLEKERTTAEEERKGWLEKIKEAIAGRPSMEELLKAGQEKYKVPELYEKLLALTPEIDTLNKKMADLDTQEQQRLLISEQKMAPMVFIRGEQALIQRQFAIQKSAVAAELGAKTALAEMYRGNIDTANKLISQTVEAQLYDIKQKIDDYKFFFDYYNDYYNTLDKDIKNTIDRQYDILTRQEELEKQNLLMKYELIQTAWKYGVDPGLSASDIKTKSFDDILAIITSKVSSKAATITATTQVPKSITGVDYNTRLKEEINNLYAGRYGVEGAREKVINILQREFPGIDVAADVYSRAPDGWESGMKGATPTLEEIKSQTKSIFQQYKDIGYTREQIEEQWKADNNTTELTPLVEDTLNEIFGKKESWWSRLWNWLTTKKII